MANFTALKTAINNAIKTNGNEEITGAILQAILDAMVETLGDSAITDLENALTTEVTNRENAVGGVADDLAAEVQARQALDYNVNNRINAEEYNRQNADAALSQTMSQGFQTLGSQMTALNAAISALNAAYQNGYLYGGIATPSSSPSNNKCFYIALQGGTYTNFGGVGVVKGINIIKNDSGWKVEHIYDQTTLLNEFYLLRQQVIRAISSIDPIVIQGDVTNAPDEEDLTSNANHLLQFKNNAYSPLEFSGLGRKYLRKNIAPLSESAPFNGFVEGVTAEETLSGTPTQIFWDRVNTRFVGIKDGIYYAAWTDDDNYVPVSTSLVYMYNGTPYQWTGSDFIVDETEVPNLVNCLTQDMINEANTIYIIRYDYTLKEDITIPANCVLHFDGGSISGEFTLTGTNTCIEAGLVKIFGTDITLSGTWIVSEAYPEWFGAKGDGVTDCTNALKKLISYFDNIIVTKGTYIITDTIFFSRDGISIIGNISTSRNNVMLKFNTSAPAFKFYDTARYITIANLMLRGNNKENVCFDFSQVATNKDLFFITLNNLHIDYFDKGISSTQYSPTLWNCEFSDIRLEACNYGIYLDGESVGKHFGVIFKRVVLLSCTTSLVYIKDNINVEFDACNFGVNNKNDIYIYGYDSWVRFNNCNIECDSVVTAASGRIINLTGGRFIFDLCTFVSRTGSIPFIYGDNLRGLIFSYCKYSGENSAFWGTLSVTVSRCILLTNNSIPSIDTYISSVSKDVVTSSQIFPIVDTGVSGYAATLSKNAIYKRKTDGAPFYVGNDNKVHYFNNNVISPYNSGGTSERPTNYDGSLSGIGYRFFDYERKLVCIQCIDHYEIIPTYKYIGDLPYGSSSNRPYIQWRTTGHPYFDITINRPIFADKNKRFIKADGSDADAATSGTFANKPTSDKIYVGYPYFCTDKQTTEGGRNGIVIYYNGQDTTEPDNPVDVWVDALGRVVS